MVATPESPARTYGCPWCGGNPERKSAKGPPPLFCSPKCRTAMEGLKLADGRAIIAFARPSMSCISAFSITTGNTVRLYSLMNSVVSGCSFPPAVEFKRMIRKE